MIGQQHCIEVYEPYEYEGVNPLTAQGMAVLIGPTRETYYLLSLKNPFQFELEAVEQLLVMPHYNGDKIDRAVSSTCTVNIARVPPGILLNCDARLSYDNIIRWGVGKIRPLESH